IMDEQRDDNCTAAEVMFVNFLVEHNISFNTADHSTTLVKNMFYGSKVGKNFCGRTKSTYVLKNALAPHVRDPLLANLYGLFSLIVDESTDRGDDKQLAMVVKYYDENQLRVETKFYRLRIVNSAIGENLFKAVKDAFQGDNIKWENVMGLGTDGAENMIGKNNSLISRIKEKQPHLYTLHCVCHVNHICVSDAHKKLPNYLDNFFVELFWHFHHSEVLKGYQEFTDTVIHKILKPCSARWLQLEACTNRTLDQRDALLAYFRSHRMRKTKKIQKLRAWFEDPLTRLHLMFLSAILPLFTKFNVMFQAKQPNIHRLTQEMNQFLRNFLSRFVKQSVVSSTVRPQDVNYTIIDNQKPDCDFFIGLLTRALVDQLINDGSLSREEEKKFYSDVRNFYMARTKNLIKKLPLDDQVLKDAEMLRPSRKDILQTAMRLAKRFPNIIQEGQLEQLQEECFSYECDTDLPDDEDNIEKYWGLVGKLTDISSDKKYPILTKLAKAILVLLHSSADVERLFSSQMTLVKTQLRNRLNNDTLEDILYLITNHCCYETKPCAKLLKKAKPATYDYLKQLQNSEY
uniref:HAT C-terminal dimerisation domain-containing protein n=1 Tax=Latimeria chalumnae TaxID=7897 RepID=H2ZXB7_LATCH